jgi:protein phosphatase 2C family protein 2/3
VSRTFGDVEAKEPIFGGVPNVVIAEPEIISFKLNSDADFLLLGCNIFIIK